MSDSLDPFDYSLDVVLHVVDLVTSEFEDDLWLVALLDLFLEDVEYLALDVLRDLVLVVPALLQPVIQLRVVAPQQHDQLEPPLREKVARVELKDYAPASAHQRLQLVAHHVHVELWHVELLIPILVQLLRLYQICQLHILETLNLVLLLELVLKECAQGGLAHTRRTRDQNVWKARRLKGLLHIYN